MGNALKGKKTLYELKLKETEKHTMNFINHFYISKKKKKKLDKYKKTT